VLSGDKYQLSIKMFGDDSFKTLSAIIDIATNSVVTDVLSHIVTLNFS
jgi:hypothetical protein